MRKTVRELIEMYKDGGGSLHANISTQREFIYNTIPVSLEDGETTKAGNLIKSILERHIQLPALYFWKVNDPANGIIYKDNEYNIHDGKQRFLSIYYFVNGKVTTILNGKERIWDTITDEQRETILNYTFDIVIREGTCREEEESFFFINSSGEALTTYEAIKGAFHGRYLTEFENYLNNKGRKYDAIREIGRGDQAIWLLYIALGVIDEKSSKDEKLCNLAKDKLNLCRNSSFDASVNKFDIKIDYYAELIKSGTMKKDISKKPLKICQIATYIADHNLDFAAVKGYYVEGLSKDNDINRWEFNFHRDAIDKLCQEGKRLYFRRFFTSEEKSTLFGRSQRCACCNLLMSFNELQVDHIIPWVEGGTTTINNAQLLCETCNKSKGATI